MNWRQNALQAAVVLVSLVSQTSWAQDTTPKVDPKRIDDVPAGLPEIFRPFDNFSWRAFIALNWPALGGAANRGLPDQTKKLGDPGPRVWETYKARYEVFLPGAPEPAKWDTFDGRNPCGQSVSNQVKTLSAFNKFADFNQADKDITKIANPLIAQNRTYTRYEVRMNRQEFDSIDANKWYIRGNLPTKDKPGKFNLGSIEVKAAWRILNERDTPAIRARFYVAKDTLVFDPVKSKAAGAVVCDKQDVALVGFHIVIKTPLRPQWIWSSFEHVDNVPPIGIGDDREPDAKLAGVPYSYNDPSKPQALDAPPEGITTIHEPEADPNPTQVIRKFKIQSDTMKLNREYWALDGIKGTVWANYMLVMTQWPTKVAPENPTNSGKPFPDGGSNLANTTMETYHQSMGCMECHQVVSNKDGRDFVAFMMIDAADPSQAALQNSVAPGVSSLQPMSTKKSLGASVEVKKDPGISALIEILRQNMNTK
jgi:hypothetical protein